MSANATISRDLALRLERAHERFSAAIYGGDAEELPSAQLATNRSIAEPEWNHGWALAPERAAWPGALDGIAARLGAPGRPAAVVGSTIASPELLDYLGEAGWQEAFRFALLLAPDDVAESAPAWPEGATVETVGRRQLAEFSDLFDRSFYETSHGESPTGYREAFARALERPLPGVEVEHTLVRLEGEVAAIGTRAQGDELAGLYNVGVARRFRGRGLAAALKRYRIARARAGGARMVFEFTEDPRVEAAELKRGFVRAFELVGYVAPGSGPTDRAGRWDERRAKANGARVGWRACPAPTSRSTVVRAAPRALTASSSPRSMAASGKTSAASTCSTTVIWTSRG